MKLAARCAVACLTLAGCATARVVDRLHQQDIYDEIVAHRGELAACMSAHLATGPAERHGKLLARFVILPSGLAQPDEARSEGPPALVKCVLDVVARARFPQHRQPMEPITFPMSF